MHKMVNYLQTRNMVFQEINEIIKIKLNKVVQ